MKKDISDVKLDIVIVGIILMFLFLFCFIFFSKSNNIDLNINTITNIDGNISEKNNLLQNTIPYIEVQNKNIKTAYQQINTDYRNINDSVFLQLSTNKGYLKKDEITKNVYNNYGEEIILIFRNFNINGFDNCLFNSNKDIYNCEKIDYKGEVFKAKRNILNTILENDTYSLFENILFYSEKTIDNITTYRVYDSSSYLNEVSIFTNLDLQRENKNLDEFLRMHYANYFVKYKSNFSNVNNNYIWESTGVYNG